MAKVRPLPPALAEAAKAELNEDPARLESDLQHLKEWLRKQPHLRARTDDQFLVAFLRGAKFSLERAKEKLDAYYTLRSALPEFFADRDPTAPEIKYILNQGLFVPLGVDGEGRRVVLMRVAAYDPARVHASALFKLNLMLMDVMVLEDDAMVVKGHVGVLDLAGMTLAHATHLSPALVKRATTVFQEGYPLRPKALHYLNMSPAFETIFNLFKSFMKDKLKRRINIHSDLASLQRRVPAALLPQEYGGAAGPLRDISGAWAAKLEAWRQYFADDALYGCDESKRPGRPKTHQDLFGLEGSFRPLNVD